MNRIIVSLIISIVIYFLLAGLFIIFGKPKENSTEQKGLDFQALLENDETLPDLVPYTARDGEKLEYRYYPSESNRILVLLHGSGWHSSYLAKMANYLSSNQIATVYTPDLRGHGYHPSDRGDIDYIAQYEDDIADLVSIIKKEHPQSQIFIGGHSSGGGLAVRFAGSEYAAQIDGFLFISPFLKYNAPTARPNSGGWARPNNLRIAGLVMLNNLAIRSFNHLPVIEFNMPENARDGSETLAYTYRLNTGYAPMNYKKDLRNISQPVLVVVGSKDEAFYADQFEPVISKYVQAEFVMIKDASHMSVMLDRSTFELVESWIKKISR